MDLDEMPFKSVTGAQMDLFDVGLPGDWAATIWLMHGCGLRIGEALAVSEHCVISDQASRLSCACSLCVPGCSATADAWINPAHVT
jgi:hypothetical protein